MAEHNKEPELHNEQLESAVQDFKKNQTNENMVKIMAQLEKATVMQPALLPADVEKEKIRDLIRQGQGGKVPVKLNAQMRPRPAVLKNEKGEQFFAVFTGKAQIPPAQKYPAMIFLPFKECSKMAMRKELQLTGIVLNPFTDNLILHKALLEMLNNRVAGQSAGRQMLPGDRIMITELPGRFHQDRAGFMQEISAGKEDFAETFFREAYRKIKGENVPCPYRKTDFEVLTLNISGTLQMARIGLSESGSAKGQFTSAFCFYNPETGEGIYYLLRKGVKGGRNKLLCVDEKGACSELGDAPSEGSELYELIEKVPW